MVLREGRTNVQYPGTYSIMYHNYNYHTVRYTVRYYCTGYFSLIKHQAVIHHANARGHHYPVQPYVQCIFQRVRGV